MTFAASLYYSNYQKNGNKVMDCLKKAIKIADKCMTEVKNIYLFINILNKYLYYYYIDAEFVSSSILTSQFRSQPKTSIT